MNLISFFFKLPNVLRSINKARVSGILYHTIRSRFPIRKNVVLLESHNGKDFIGNPYYITRHLLMMPEFKKFQIIVAGGSDAKKAVKTLPNHQSIKTCSIHSVFYCYWLAIAEYLITDATFPIYFSRRDNQKYLNTWHGTPLKTLGRQIANDPFSIANTQRNFLHATHILAPNLHTEQMLLKTYMIDQIWKGMILRNGYPRNDIFFVKKPFGYSSTDSNIFNIAFMPTWRGSLANIEYSAKIQCQKLVKLFFFLENALSEKINLWVRLHPLIKNKLNLSNFKKINEFPVDKEPYDFLSKCDMLITDYSSVMFDFSITRKPIILFVPDESDYISERNFCLDFSIIPFIKTRTAVELVHSVLEIIKNGFNPSQTYEIFVKKFCPYDHADTTAILCSTFFNNKFETEKDNRKKIVIRKKNLLIFVGSFWNNGITTSLKNLLSNLDKDRYNIFLWIDKSTGEKNATVFFSNLDSRICYIPTQNFLAAGFLDIFPFFWQFFFYNDFSPNDIFLKDLWQKEYDRQFGTAMFDAVIHFSGYERRVALIQSVIKTKRIIYVHNDMFLENKHKKKFDQRTLKLAYLKADKIAAVRTNVTEKYCKHTLDISSKVHHVPNCLNNSYFDLIRADVLDSISNEYGQKESDRLVAALKQPKRFRFINLGRFSWEKGQERLIEAFEKIWKIHPNSQLFILGGYGEKFDTLIQRQRKSPASQSIFIFIGSNNIFPLLSRMDVMILASFYEGLPMVIFESLALNIPVISTDISGPSDFLKEGYGLVVKNSVAGLTEGMLAGINGQIPFKPYDFHKHNRDAIERFYSLIED
jgi:CDP-glycerol glycerophosphotransferase